MALRIPKKNAKIAPKKDEKETAEKFVVVGTYKAKQLAWIEKNGVYNYPVRDGDEFADETCGKVDELWLYADAKGTRHAFGAKFVGKMTREDFAAKYPTYPKSPKTKNAAYYVFETAKRDYGPSNDGQFVIARTADFGGRSAKVKKAVERFKADGEFAPLAAYLPPDLAQVPRNRLRVCEAAVQMEFFNDKMEFGTFAGIGRRQTVKIVQNGHKNTLCRPIADYGVAIHRCFDRSENAAGEDERHDIRVVELFAGVGGFRVGLERASPRYKTVWNNQWEPATKRQDASIVYSMQFGSDGHSNIDIATVSVDAIPQAELLVGGFPCQDYSVATTLKNAGGIEGKKGVLWWQIHRILRDKGKDAPKYLILENVDRLLKSPATQRGRDFAIILASLSDLGYSVEWRVINAADYGMPQRRRRTYMVAYRRDTVLAEEARRALAAPDSWILRHSVEARAFAVNDDDSPCREFDIFGDLTEVTQNFNKAGAKASPFLNAGFMVDRHVCTMDVVPVYEGSRITLGQLVVDEAVVPEEFFIRDAEIDEWRYLKGPKSEERTAIGKDGKTFSYHYSEGGMAFPDSLDKPSRTVITGEGGKGASRFKHVILTPSGRYRRLIPLELERLNMFPDNHTEGASDIRRAFLMGNALVTGIVERIGIILKEYVG